ncbi:MAG: prolipoprotein diacylglyceryl transferase [Chloroflexi bacterium]|nr:prolipoprotein diacylglyceryl transferase [Chloroflexota bacterium]
MPQGFNIGPLTIRFYAILIIFGAIVGAWLAARQAKKHGDDPEIVLDLLPWLLIGGIIGARLWHVFTPSASNIAQGVTTENYLRNPVEILKMWNGGLGIPGAVIGGILALIIYSKIKKINFWEWADFIAPGLLIGQAIGRWGNFINQEVYGRPTDLPWAISIDPQFRISGFEHVEKYHPLFLYESILNLIGAGILLWVDRKYKDKLYRGDILFGYLIWYSTVRFFLEFLRLDPSPVNGINVNQTAMLVVGVLALIVLILRHTVWSKKLESKELAERERKLALAEEDQVLFEAASAESEVVEIGFLSEEIEPGLPDELGVADEIEPLIDDDEDVFDEESILLEDEEDWVLDNLVGESEEWVEQEVSELEEEEPLEIDDESLTEDPEEGNDEEIL